MTHSSSVFCAHCEEVAAPNHRPGFRHHEVVIIGAFAQALFDLWRHIALRRPDKAYDAARLAIHCAHMLELKEDCR